MHVCAYEIPFQLAQQFAFIVHFPMKRVEWNESLNNHKRLTCTGEQPEFLKKWIRYRE